MSLMTDVINALGSGAGVIWEGIRPWKEAILGLCVITGGAIAAFVGGYRRQSRRPEEALEAAAAYSTRTTVFRLHHDDKQSIGDLQEAVVDLTRAMRNHRKSVDDHREAMGS